MSANGALTPDEVRARTSQMEKDLNKEFPERRTPIAAAFLAIFAKEHMFMLGPPGTGKSMLIRRIFERIHGATYFEALLSKRLPSEAILGPYDIPELRDHGHMHRKIQGFLPTSNFALLDEVGKMSDSLGHDLLAVTNERRFHQVNGGRSWVDVPLYSFFGGSNELPTDESEQAAAMWDRMLVRTVVDVIQETSNWVAVLQGSTESVANPATVDFDSLAHVIDHVIPTIPIPTNVFDVLITLKTEMEREEIYPSDRRWRQSMKLLQASAWRDGRDEVDVIDVGVLRHTLWELPTQIDKVERLTLGISDPVAEEALKILEQVEEIAAQVRDIKDLATEKRAAMAVELNGKLSGISSEYSAATQKAKSLGHATTKLEEVGTRLKAVQHQILSDVLGVGELI